MLFEAWYNRYLTDETPESRRAFNQRWHEAFAEPWDPARPIETPVGLADPAKAVRSLEWAMADTKRLFGRWDVAQLPFAVNVRDAAAYVSVGELVTPLAPRSPVSPVNLVVGVWWGW